MIFDQSNWGHIRLTGPDRVRFLQGMCTANIETLRPGDWTRAAILSPKGRVVSVIEVLCSPEGNDLLVSCQPDLADKTYELLSKHAIMDEVEFERVAQPMHRIWDSPQAVWDAPPVLAPAPAPAADPDAIDALRVEAGLPIYGRDVNDDNFPFESLLSRYIDYDKGCYLGQEPVSRVHHRGGANKMLRGLKFEPAAPDQAAPAIAAGDQVSHPERENAGIVTSRATSPRLGDIALALIHRSVFEPGTEVTVSGRRAQVVELPFAL